MCQIITRCILFLVFLVTAWFQIDLNYSLYIEDSDQNTVHTLVRHIIGLLYVWCHFSWHKWCTSCIVSGLSTSSDITPPFSLKNMRLDIPLPLPQRLNQPIWRVYGSIWQDAKSSNSYAPATVFWYLYLPLYVPFFKSYKSSSYRFSSTCCMKQISLKRLTSMVIYTKVALVIYFPSSCSIQITCSQSDISMFCNILANLVR